jgi:hypothetical protein
MARLKAAYAKDGKMDQLRYSMLEDKVFDFMLSKVKVSEVDESDSKSDDSVKKGAASKKKSDDSAKKGAASKKKKSSVSSDKKGDKIEKKVDGTDKKRAAKK